MKYSDLEFKKDQIAYIREKLSSDEYWAIRGLVRLYEYQTNLEKEFEGESTHNGIGFNRIDRDVLTSFAKFWGKNKYLTGPQMKRLRRVIPKYAGQLHKIAEGNQ